MLPNGSIMPPPIFYVARMVPRYRVPILEGLDERLGGRLIVFHGNPPKGSSLAFLTRTQPPSYRCVPLKNVWIRGETLHVQDVTLPFRKHGRPGVILAEESPRSLSLPPLLLAAKAWHVPTVLWGHFSSNVRALSTGNVADRYRIWLARQARACLCYTEDIREMLTGFIDPERLFVAANTLDIRPLLARRDELVREGGKAAVRQRLGLPPDRPIVVFPGRLDQKKGIHRLPEIISQVTGNTTPGLLLIGDGPDREALRRSANRVLDHVRCTGALSPEAAAPYLFASDVALIPGPAGLAVNHAFALGLPVIAQRSPGPERYHSPEIAYVQHGSNGLLVPYGDNRAMANAVEAALRDLDRLSTNALEYAKTRLHPDRMIDGILEALHYAEKHRNLSG